jgi:hypothetical protein
MVTLKFWKWNAAENAKKSLSEKCDYADLRYSKVSINKKLIYSDAAYRNN